MKVLSSCLLLVVVLLSGCHPIQPERFPLEDGGGKIVRMEDVDRYGLAVNDMPEGWVLFEDIPLASNEELAETRKDPAGALAKLKSLGREGGKYQYFGKPGSYLGTNEIRISVVVLKNPKAAIDYIDFNYLRDVENIEKGEVISMSPVSAPAFGETSIVRFGKKTGTKDSLVQIWTWYDISFQIHNVSVFIEAYSAQGSGDMTEAVKVARLIEEKLRQ